jgi:hypothetical protein
MKTPEPTTTEKMIRPSDKTLETLTSRTSIRSQYRKTQALQGIARESRKIKYVYTNNDNGDLHTYD